MLSGFGIHFLCVCLRAPLLPPAQFHSTRYYICSRTTMCRYEKMPIWFLRKQNLLNRAPISSLSTISSEISIQIIIIHHNFNCKIRLTTDCRHISCWNLKSVATSTSLKLCASQSICNICMHKINIIIRVFLIWNNTKKNYSRVFLVLFIRVLKTVFMHEALRYGNFSVQIISIFVYWNWWHRNRNDRILKRQ